MLKGPAQPENSFFDGESRRDSSAQATASAVAAANCRPHFGNGIGPAGYVGGGNTLATSTSAESRRFVSACIPDGQLDVVRRVEIEEVAGSVSRELGAIQMSEHGGVQAWSKAGNSAEAKSAELSADGNGTLVGSGVESGGVARSKAAPESAVPMKIERDTGLSVNTSCAIKPPPSDHHRASTTVEGLPGFGGDSVYDGVSRPAAGGGFTQGSVDSPLTHCAAGSADDVSVAAPANHSDSYGHNTIPGGGPACVMSPVNANPREYSTLSATRTASNVTKENSVPGVFGTNMTKEQLRYCISVIKNLKRHPSAQEFLKPVDPIAWNIPDYTTIIKRPMDLGTVDDKLAAGQYADPDAFAEDVRLVFQNCYLYNGRQSAFSQMAMQVELIFESQMKKVPAASPSVRSGAPPRTLRRAKTTRVGAAAPPPAAVTPQVTPTKPAAVPRPRPSSSRKSGSAARKSSSGRNSPAPGQDRQMRFCSATLNELCKKQYAEINWDFLRPVDPVALNIPEYPTIIKRPMDLSTIRHKLSAGEYSSPHEFEDDVNLMFDNCFTFNRAGDPVYVNGERLREVFLRKWKDLPLPPAPKKAAVKPSAKSASKNGESRRKSASVPARKAKGSDVEEESEESKSEAEDIETPALGNLEQLALMEAHMNMMQKRLEELKSAAVGTKHSKKKKSSRSESTPPGGKWKAGKSAKSKLSSSSLSKKSKPEVGGAASRRGSTAKLTIPSDGERDAPAAGSPSAKGKRVKKRRASEVDSSGEAGGDRSGHQSRLASTKKDAASSASGESAKPATKKAKPAAGPPVILFEHKQQLSEMINSLGEDKLETVIEIIHDSMPHLRGATEEVELDIDALDYGSFYRLYNYVVNDVRPSKKGTGAGRGGGGGPAGKGKSGVGGKSGGNGGAAAADRPPGGEANPASPPSAAADTTSASSASDAAAGGGFAGGGLEKKKYLSEEEQTQQIMVLEEKLRRFADVAAAHSPEEEKREADSPDSDSSDESAESGNESSDGSLA